MDVKEAIRERRAYRSLKPFKITKEIVRDMARSVQLAPSCFNNQPWRMVFVYGKGPLESMRPALSVGNEWAYAASLIVAVFSKKEDDCIIRDRVYHQFDCGLGIGFLVLRATELGLVAHPIAGFSPKKTKEILHIPEEYDVITLVIVGKLSEKLSPVLSEKQISWEKKRPKRIPLDKMAFLNRFGQTK